MISITGQGAGHDYDQVLRLISLPGRPGGNFEWTASVPFCARPSQIASDLLRIGRAVHLADRHIRRGAPLSRNLRRIAVQVAVAEPRRWRRLADRLADLAEFATGGDSWTLTFVAHPGDKPLGASLVAEEGKARGNVVALFSGGLDSLCGAAYLAAQSTSRPIFVTHSPPGAERAQSLVADTFAAFGRALAPGSFASYRLVLREVSRDGVRSMFQEPTRRTRPFFYLALACATAVACEVDSVQMSENGALALSLPHRYDAHGPSIARQAHAYLLAGFEDLLRELVPSVRWRVTNPFAHETKGEACGRLKAAAAHAARSESCEYLGRQRAVILRWKQKHRRMARNIGTGPQCGLCVPCIVRRAALRRAGVPEDGDAYFASAPEVLRLTRRAGSATSLFAGNHAPPLLGHVAANPLYMERHAEWILSSSATEFAVQFLPELRANRTLQGVPKMTAASFHALAKRYANELLAFLRG